MRILATYVLVFLGLVCEAQWTDNFDNGNLSNPVLWQGDLDSFEVLNGELHLNAPPNQQESYLSTSSNGAVAGFWEFVVRMDFNPSATNRALVYLTANQPNLKDTVYGYFVMIGNSTDEVSLYRSDGTSTTKIIDGVDGFVNTASVSVNIKVERTATGNFTLFADSSSNFNTYLQLGTASDATYLSSAYFGMLCDYTATRSDKFYFDEIVVAATQYQDLWSPELLNYTIPNRHQIVFNFNEPIAAAQNVFVNNEVFSDYQISENTMQLTFSEPLSRKVSYNFELQGVIDTLGNVADTSFSVQLSNLFDWKEIIINEIYADESPSYGLPDGEFIELWNTTSDTLFLENWQIADQLDTAAFLLDTLFPNELVILCKTSLTAEYQTYGKTIGVYGMPGWNNSSDFIYLLDAFDFLIDSVHYDTDWFENSTNTNGDLKSDGGYSLQRLMENGPCSDAYYWLAGNEAIGGSPGAMNENLNGQNATETLSIAYAAAMYDSILVIQFTEEINAAFVEMNNFLVLDSLNGIALEIAEFEVNNDLRQIKLLMSDVFLPNIAYQLSIYQLFDCYGEAWQFNVPFYLVRSIEQGDLVINEILFNPFTGGYDFVELYNTSDYALNLSDVRIVEYDFYDPDLIIDELDFGELFYFIAPQEYVVVTEDSEALTGNYLVLYPENIVESDMPNFPDNQGCMSLYYDTLQLEKFCYLDDWHIELLPREEGVSLERINPFSANLTKTNWHSAAASVGFATPTYQNSQFFQVSNEQLKFEVTPVVFTPNGDGIADFALIQIYPNLTNFIVNTTIFDSAGRVVKTLANNQLIGTEQIWKWDGTYNNGNEAMVGIYIVQISLFNEEGRVERLHKTVVLGANL